MYSFCGDPDMYTDFNTKEDAESEAQHCRDLQDYNRYEVEKVEVEEKTTKFLIRTSCEYSHVIEAVSKKQALIEMKALIPEDMDSFEWSEFKIEEIEE